MSLKRKMPYRGLLLEYRAAILLLFLFIIFTVMSRRFFTVDNIRQVLKNESLIAIVVCGQTMVIIGGGIDLSVGSLLMLCSAVTARLVVGNSLNPILIILTVLAIGALAGLVNGVLCTKGKIKPFIVTLAMMGIIRGLALIVTGGRNIPSVNAPWFLRIGQGRLFSIPIPILIAVVGIVLTIILIRMTTFGRGLYALGGNRKVAWLSGIRVSRIAIITYVLCGITAAVASIIQISWLASYAPTIGKNFELETILAAVIGGISLQGGKGHIVGAIFGVMFVGFIWNGLLMLGISFHLETIIIGIVFIAAVALDRFIQQQIQS